MYFCEIENFAYGEINERSFSNPHPRLVVLTSPLKDVELPDVMAVAANGFLNMRMFLS